MRDGYTNEKIFPEAENFYCDTNEPMKSSQVCSRNDSNIKSNKNLQTGNIWNGENRHGMICISSGVQPVNPKKSYARISAQFFPQMFSYLSLLFRSSISLSTQT